MDKDGFFLWLCRSGYSELTAELYVALVGGMIAKGSTPNTPIKQVISPFSPSTHANRRISWKLWCRWTQGPRQPNRITQEEDGSATLWLTNRAGQEVDAAWVDVSDLPLVTPYRWSLTVRGRKKYVISQAPSFSRGRKVLYLHQLLLPAESAGKEVDHIDGDGRNNRRNNLRLVSHPEQMENLPARTSSGHRNVYWNSNRWMVKVCKGGVQHYGGRFEHLPEAVEAARALRKELFTHAEEGRAQCAPGVGRPRKDLE